MAIQKDTRLAWGISLLTFGVVFLLKQLNIIPTELQSYIFDYKNYPLIIGAIFLIFHKNKSIGFVLIVLSILFWISDFIRVTQYVSDFIWSALLILAGAILVFGVKKGK